MRFHRAEIAFVAFMLLIFLSGAAIVHVQGIVRAAGDILLRDSESAAAFTRASGFLQGTGFLLLLVMMIGVVFIHPLIRRQINSEKRLLAMTRRLSARSEKLQHAALTDPLTGMHNRRYFDDALREYLEEFGRIGKPVGLMIFDLDHFKSVNDTHGHDVGDEVLRSVAEALIGMTRFHDVVARLGGEEFAIVAPNMDRAHLEKFAERIRTAIASIVIDTGETRFSVTTSIGVAVWQGHESPEEFFRRADKRLYQAKRSGRNCICA